MKAFNGVISQEKKKYHRWQWKTFLSSLVVVLIEWLNFILPMEQLIAKCILKSWLHLSDWRSCKIQLITNLPYKIAQDGDVAPWKWQWKSTSKKNLLFLLEHLYFLLYLAPCLLPFKVVRNIQGACIQIPDLSLSELN